MVVNVDDPELPSGIIMSSAGSSPDIYRPKIAETITVDQSGHGEFTTDTLSYSIGRHYFESCRIQGLIDFIWGSGHSIYQNSKINAIAAVLGNGPGEYITAQERDSGENSSGHVFSGRSMVHSTYLGRADRNYLRVMFC
ncbi:probable pectinesterase 55 [Punica granatum]|uniref:pectinesterase n=1 Tax=Punica granatum TaxID=22663 RepID=A0A6P8DJJ6_PUNGR|nr:probable pectinesterase 55 [Punica granatum]